VRLSDEFLDADSADFSQMNEDFLLKTEKICGNLREIRVNLRQKERV
jgi:hypothetical protein